MDATGFFPATLDIQELVYKDKSREKARKVRVEKKSREFEASKEEREERKKQRIINSAWSVNRKVQSSPQRRCQICVFRSDSAAE